jgi:hypothetical protein
VKGSYRKLVIVVAVLLVVGVAGSVLFAQAMAGDGVGFSVMKALADTGGADVVIFAAEGPGAEHASRVAGVSCDVRSGGCGGEEEGSSCGMGASDAEAGGCAVATPGAEDADAKTDAVTDTETE